FHVARTLPVKQVLRNDCRIRRGNLTGTETLAYRLKYRKRERGIEGKEGTNGKRFCFFSFRLFRFFRVFRLLVFPGRSGSGAESEIKLQRHLRDSRPDAVLIQTEKSVLRGTSRATQAGLSGLSLVRASSVAVDGHPTPPVPGAGLPHFFHF
ncbi:MAG: hypothetical protein ACKV2V_28215, partial [Blastocatellia bacterium]